MQDSDKPDSPDRRELLCLALAMGGLFAASEQASAGGHFAPPPMDIPSSAPDEVFAAIDKVLQRTREIWNSQDFGALKEVWDASDPEPWYIPEEVEQPFFSWPQLEKYWNPGRKVLKGFRWDYDSLRVKMLGEDLGPKEGASGIEWYQASKRWEKWIGDWEKWSERQEQPADGGESPSESQAEGQPSSRESPAEGQKPPSP